MQMKTPKNSYKGRWDTKRKPRKGWLPNPRDTEILEFVWQHGFLTPHHIGWILELSKRRSEELLKRLWDNGYLNRPEPKLRARYPFMPYVLTKRGADVVAQKHRVRRSELDWVKEPSWQQVEHDASITDFRIILTKACERDPDFTFQQWIGETTFRSRQDQVVYHDLKGNERKKRIYIDGYALIKRFIPNEDDKYFRLLIEAELSPKTNPRFADDKILPQYAYLRSKIYDKFLGSKTGRYLYIVPTREKLDNFRRSVEGALPRKEWVIFYFTTYEQISVDSILYDKIWLRAGSDRPVPLFKS